jgi:hypothetical protein
MGCEHNLIYTEKNSDFRIVLMTFYFLKPKTIPNCGLDSKLYRLNLALILIGQFIWAELIKSYNGNTITLNFRAKFNC